MPTACLVRAGRSRAKPVPSADLFELLEERLVADGPARHRAAAGRTVSLSVGSYSMDSEFTQ